MKNLRWITAVAITVLLTACTTPGRQITIPIEMPNGKTATIVTYDNKIPAWLRSPESYRLSYVYKGSMSPEQLEALARTERACLIKTNASHPNTVVAVITSGGLYALAGGLGVGLGAKAFTGAVTSQYAKYGAWASGAAGAANGAITVGGREYTFENCGREVLSLFPEYSTNLRILSENPN